MILTKPNGQPDVEAGLVFLAHHNNVDEKWIIISVQTQSVRIAPLSNVDNWIFMENSPSFFKHLGFQEDCKSCKLVRGF